MRRFAARTPKGTVLVAAIAVTMGLAGSCRTLPKGPITGVSVPTNAATARRYRRRPRQEGVRGASSC